MVYNDFLTRKNMTTKLTSPVQVAKPPLGLFDTVPEDAFNFGIGKRFDAKRITELLNLKKQDVSRLASVSAQSVRYDEAIPEQVRDRLEEIGITINMVAKVFDGDVEKTAVWFRARNPMLGDVSPRDMIRLGRFERLRKFIITAMSANEAQVRRALKTS